MPYVMPSNKTFKSHDRTDIMNACMIWWCRTYYVSYACTV